METYRIINMDKLLSRLSCGSIEEFWEWHKKTMTSKLICNIKSREAYWSEAVAVGSNPWLESIAAGNPEIKRCNIHYENGVPFLKGKK